MYLLSKARAFLKVLGTLILFPTAKDIRLCSKDHKSLTAASGTPGYLEDHRKSATATSIWITGEFSHIGSFFLMTSFSVTFAFFFVFRTIVNTFHFIACKLALVFITWNIPILKEWKIVIIMNVSLITSLFGILEKRGHVKNVSAAFDTWLTDTTQTIANCEMKLIVLPK